MIIRALSSGTCEGTEPRAVRAHSISAGRSAVAFRLEGPLDADVLERSLSALVSRHESLRTTFHDQAGQAYQQIASLGTFRLQRQDVQQLAADQRQQRLEELLKAAAGEPLDIERGPLLRALLVTVGPQEHVLLLLVHHLVFDGWSEEVLFRELGQLYAAFAQGQPAPLAELPLQYADYAAWQQRNLTDGRLDAARDYWKAQLDGAPSRLELPTDHPRTGRATSAGRTLFRTLSPQLSDALRQFSRREQTTLFVTLLAAFEALLYRYTGQEDLVVGTAVAQRQRRELEGLIGFFANTLALRTRLSGQLTFRQLLARVAEVTSQALVHQELPFDEVVSLAALARRSDQPEWLQVAFVLHNASAEGLHLPGLAVSRVPVDPGTAKFELTLVVVDQPQGLELWFEYHADLFQPDTIARFAHHYQQLLQACLDQPDHAIQAMTPATEQERNRLRPAEQAPERREAIHEFIAPRAATEESVASIWRRLLGVETIGVRDNFFQIGGHSLLVVRLAAELESEFGKRIPIGELFQSPTIEAQSGLLDRPSVAETIASLTTLQDGQGPALIILPGTQGAGRLSPAVMSHLPADLRVVGVNVDYAQPENARETIEELATDCAESIWESDIPQPYQLVGYSFGGMLAYEVARQLRAQGARVGLVGIVDTGPVFTAKPSLARRFVDLRYFLANAPARIVSKLRSSSSQKLHGRIWRRLRQTGHKVGSALHLYSSESPLDEIWDDEIMQQLPEHARIVERAHLKAFCAYLPGAYPGAITLFRAKQRPLFRGFAPDFGWRQFTVGSIDIRIVPGDHSSMLNEPDCQDLAHEIYDAFVQSLEDEAVPDIRQRPIAKI